MRVNETVPLRIAVPGRNLSVADSLDLHIKDPTGSVEIVSASVGGAVEDGTLGSLLANEYAEVNYTPTVSGKYQVYLVETTGTVELSTDTFVFTVLGAYTP